MSLGSFKGRARLGIVLAGCGLWLALPASAQTLRVAAYNVELDTGATTPNSYLDAVVEDIGNETTYDGAHPLDILGLEETTSNATTVSPIVSALNSYYSGKDVYAMSSYQATEEGGDPSDGNGPNALIYNTTTLTLLNSTGVGTPEGDTNGEYRQVVRYEFQPVGGAAAQDFYVYVTHMKSSYSGSETTNETDRNEEATLIRQDEATLPANSSVIYMGDFNMDGTSEPGYQTMLAAGSGQAIDPLNPTDASETWSKNSAYSSILTESTQTTFDYREDLQLMDSNIYNGTSTALSYVAGSEHAFGNYGTETAGSDYYTGSTPAAGNYSNIPYDLTQAADHLPIVADYTIVSVPEPAALGMVILGAVGLGLGRRRRRRRGGRI